MPEALLTTPEAAQLRRRESRATPAAAPCGHAGATGDGSATRTGLGRLPATTGVAVPLVILAGRRPPCWWRRPRSRSPRRRRGRGQRWPRTRAPQKRPPPAVGVRSWAPRRRPR